MAQAEKRLEIVYTQLLRTPLVSKREVNAFNCNTFATLINAIIPITDEEKTGYSYIRQLCQGNERDFVQFVGSIKKPHWVLASTADAIAAALKIDDIVSLYWQQMQGRFGCSGRASSDRKQRNPKYNPREKGGYVPKSITHPTHKLEERDDDEPVVKKAGPKVSAGKRNDAPPAKPEAKPAAVAPLKSEMAPIPSSKPAKVVAVQAQPAAKTPPAPVKSAKIVAKKNAD